MFLWLLIGSVGQGEFAIPAKSEERTGIEDRWLSVDEIAAYLGIKRDTVYKWIERRNMPAHKAGRLWKFRKEEVDRWVRQGGGSEDSDDEVARQSDMDRRRV